MRLNYFLFTRQRCNLISLIDCEKTQTVSLHRSTKRVRTCWLQFSSFCKRSNRAPSIDVDIYVAVPTPLAQPTPPRRISVNIVPKVQGIVGQFYDATKIPGETSSYMLVLPYILYSNSFRDVLLLFSVGRCLSSQRICTFLIWQTKIASEKFKENAPGK